MNNNTVEPQNMSVQAVWNIRDARGLNQDEKAFLFVVASRGVMTSAWRTAADDMGMKKDRFFRTRKALIAKGLVREGLRKDDTTVYRIDEDALASLVPAKEKADNSIAWVEAPVAVVEPVEAPVEPEPVSEPQKPAESVVEAPEDDADEDVFADYEPEGYEKPAAKPAKKSRKKVEEPAMKTMTERLAEVKAAKNADQETADRFLDESDDPVEARRLFNDKTWSPHNTDPVTRASAAAFMVEKVLEPVASKSVTDSFDEEW